MARGRRPRVPAPRQRKRPPRAPAWPAGDRDEDVLATVPVVVVTTQLADGET